MSETIVEEHLVVEEEEVAELEEDSKSPSAKSPKKKEKNPNRVKQGFKLAAIGQQAKEEKMRKRVQEEMIKPTTWITVGVVVASVGFLGLYFSPLFKTKTVTDEPVVQPSVKKEEPKSKGYFD